MKIVPLMCVPLEVQIRQSRSGRPEAVIPDVRSLLSNCSDTVKTHVFGYTLRGILIRQEEPGSSVQLRFLVGNTFPGRTWKCRVVNVWPTQY